MFNNDRAIWCYFSGSGNHLTDAREYMYFYSLTSDVVYASVRHAKNYVMIT